MLAPARVAVHRPLSARTTRVPWLPHLPERRPMARARCRRMFPRRRAWSSHHRRHPRDQRSRRREGGRWQNLRTLSSTSRAADGCRVSKAACGGRQTVVGPGGHSSTAPGGRLACTYNSAKGMKMILVVWKNEALAGARDAWLGRPALITRAKRHASSILPEAALAESSSDDEDLPRYFLPR